MSPPTEPGPSLPPEIDSHFAAEAEVTDHLKRVLRGSKWQEMRGWHALRHSFISACASKGIDQRLVQEWAGHMDEKTSRRYAHLYPSTQQEAISRGFG